VATGRADLDRRDLLPAAVAWGAQTQGAGRLSPVVADGRPAEWILRSSRRSFVPLMLSLPRAFTSSARLATGAFFEFGNNRQDIDGGLDQLRARVSDHNQTLSHRRWQISRRVALGGVVALPFTALLAEAFTQPNSSTASEAQGRGFDFLLGSWTVKHRKLKDRLKGSTEWIEFPGTLDVFPLRGIGNADENLLEDPAGAYRATSLRIFNGGAGLWSIYWIDGRDPKLDAPVVGRFEGRKGTFLGDDQFAGRPIKIRFTYEDLTEGSAQWTQAFSADQGRTWEVNWVMDFQIHQRWDQHS
jgi:hypothetical protein